MGDFDQATASGSKASTRTGEERFGCGWGESHMVGNQADHAGNLHSAYGS